MDGAEEESVRGLMGILIDVESSVGLAAQSECGPS